MEKDLLNLTQLFNKRFFRIPDYQRGYSWNKKQLEDFWEDLQLLTPEGYHYTGLITYEKIKNPKDPDDLKLIKEYSYEAYYIVDGQQRLTTISILLKVIFDKFEDDEILIDETKINWIKKFLYKQIEDYEYFLFGYETDNPSNYFFKTKILDRNISNEESRQETIYTNNLKYAKNFFREKLKKLNKKETKEIFKKLVNKLKFNTYEIDDDFEVFVTFETMNNRGKSLSKLELLKNRLIYLSTKILPDDEVDKEKLREDIKNTWVKIYNYLGKNIHNVLDDDDFLKNHWILYFPGYNRNEASVFSNFLLNKKFTIKNLLNGSINGKNIKKYVESLRLSIENYFFIKNPTFCKEFYEKYPQSIQYLEKLNRLGFSSFLPLMISMLNKKISDEDFLKTLKIIEEFIFVVFKISRNVSTFKNSKFFKYAYEFENNKIDLNKLNEEIIKIKEENIELNIFKEWIQNRFEKGKGFYDWYYELRYFLFEYELYLKNKQNNNELKIDWNNFTNLKKDYISIEHIFPQSKAKSKNDKIICNSLGNLVPLSVAINSKLQDKDFIEKKERYKVGSLSEREIYDNYNSWNKETIKERGLNLLEFMEKRWNLKFSDKEFKLALLGFN